jgi:hypothetical protein
LQSGANVDVGRVRDRGAHSMILDEDLL